MLHLMELDVAVLGWVVFGRAGVDFVSGSSTGLVRGYGCGCVGVWCGIVSRGRRKERKIGGRIGRMPPCHSEREGTKLVRGNLDAGWMVGGLRERADQ